MTSTIQTSHKFHNDLGMIKKNSPWRAKNCLVLSSPSGKFAKYSLREDY